MSSNINSKTIAIDLESSKKETKSKESEHENESCSSTLSKTKSKSSKSTQSSSSSSSMPANTKKKKPKSTFPFGMCKVCNDKATGVHYGISTCEGCKGFFKRSIYRNEYYRCFFNSTCILNPKNRNRCKECRFKKCIDVGMSVSGIKMGRISKAVREKASEAKMMDVTSSNHHLPTSTTTSSSSSNSNSTSTSTSTSSSLSPAIKSNGAKTKRKNKEKESNMSSSNNTFNSSTSSNLTRSSMSSSSTSNSNDSIGDYLEDEEDEEEEEEEEEVVDNTDDDKNFSCDSEEEEEEEEEEEKTDNKCKTNKRSLVPIERRLNRKNKKTTNLTKDSTSNKIEIKHEKIETVLNTHPNVDNNNNNNNDNNDKMLVDDEIKEKSQAQAKAILALPDLDKNRSSETSQVDSLEKTTPPSSSSSSDEIKILCTTSRTNSTSKHQDWFGRFMNIINSDNYVDKSQFYLSTPKPIMDASSNDTPNSFMSSSSSMFSHNHNNHFSTHLLTNLLKHHKPLCKSLIQPNTYYSDLFMNLQPCDSSYLLISSLLNDKIYQLYNECYKKVHEAYEKAQYLIKHNIKTFEGSECTTKEIWNYLVDSIPNFVKLVISFAKEVPGLNEIDQNDFTIVINSKLFDFYIIQNSVLFINGESYQIIANNVQYSRAWMNKIKAKEKNDILFEFAEEFNKLNLTLKEKALLSTLCFTFPEERVRDKEALNDINEYYTKALLYEFDLNKRNHEFVIRFGQIISKLKLVRMIYEAD